MNRYYLVLLKLYKQSQYKITMKEVWGTKYKYITIVLGAMILSFIGAALGLILLPSKTKLALYMIGISYMVIILSAILAVILAYNSKDDIQQRKNWLREIKQFDNLLDEYSFKIEDIERMIIYIDEYRKKKFDRSRRKFDVFWGFISVTIFSFIVSIGRSIWDSYEFKGDEALTKGISMIFIVVSLILILLLLLYLAYDSVVKIPKDEEGLKKALQEVIFSRSVKMVVTKEKTVEVLIEDDLNAFS